MKTETIKVRFLSEPGTGCRIAVFGKHPIAADHLEDFGLASASLAAFKQMFYVDAIGQNVGQGRWKGTPEEGLPWAHWILVTGPTGYLLARCVASQDSRGRKQYPLVVAAHCGGCQLKGLAEVAEILQQGVTEILTATSRETIDAWRKEAQTRLTAALTDASSADRGQFAGETTDAEQRLALFRVLHNCHHGGARPKAQVPAETVPMAGVWADWLQAMLPAKAKYLTLILADARPGATEIHLALPEAEPLRGIFPATETKRALTTEVAFQLEDGFCQHHTPKIQAWVEHRPAAVAEQPKDKLGLIGKISSIFRKTAT